MRPTTIRIGYPQPGTNADLVLQFVADNPGASTNKIIVGCKLNPTIARKCIANLIAHDLIEDKPTRAQAKMKHHAYRAISEQD